MKKIIAIIVALSMLPLSVVAAEYSNVQDEAKTAAFNLSHSVSRISYFKTNVSTSLINEEGITKLGSFSVKNNTRDGFSLTIESANDGKMHTASTDDGEEDIPYDIVLSQDGEIGEGINVVTSIASANLASPASILSLGGDSVSTPTDVKFALQVDISDDSNVMEMAGTYTDVLTLTYTDL